MKDYTKNILDLMTSALERVGLNKIRRGLCIAGGRAGVVGAIEVGEREWPDGALSIIPYCQAIWESVEREFSLIEGKKFIFGQQPTRSMLINLAPPLIFSPHEDPSHEIIRFEDWVLAEGLGRCVLMAQKDKLLEAGLAALITKESPPNPEKVFLMQKDLTPTVNPSDIAHDIRAKLGSGFLLTRFDVFYEKFLQKSAV